jgi:hypothetical protein
VRDREDGREIGADGLRAEEGSGRRVVEADGRARKNIGRRDEPTTLVERLQGSGLG